MHVSHMNLLHALTAGHISTSLGEAECVDLHSAAAESYERLSALRFDQAPVVHQRRLVGWVSTANLASVERVKAVMKRLDMSAIVSEEASIADVLQLLATDGLVFTVDQSGICGFVTPSDLERHAARTHFYLLITGIEMLLAQIVREHAAPSAVLDRLSGDSRERWDADLGAGTETDPAEYLYLRDLAELFLSLPLAGPLQGLDDRLSNVLTEVCQFRPSVMHANRSLMSGRTAAQLASMARRSEDLMARLEEIAVYRTAPRAQAGDT